MKKIFENETWVELAGSGRPKGLEGKLFLTLYGPGDVLRVGLTVKLISESSSQDFLLSSVKKEKGSLLISFEGIDSRTLLDEKVTRPFVLYVKRKDFPLLEEGEFYWVDLIGMDVYDKENKYWGKVESFSEAAQILLHLKNHKGEEVCLPWVKHFFPELDLKNNKLVCIFPEEVS